jgi:uncharacterized protein YecT (DUF1311 family)
MILLLMAAIAAQTPNACKTSMEQATINQCARREYESADAQMNRAWRVLVRETRKFDREIRRNGDSRATYSALLTAQRNWVKFRDSQCEAEANQYLGGSMAPGVEYTCLARVTQARTKELNNMTANFRQ